jgi:hypothetical protein
MLCNTDHTLAYHLSLPEVNKVSFASLPMPHVTLVIQQQMAGFGGSQMPEGDAVRFYTLNHLMSELRKRVSHVEPLDKEHQQLAESYHRVVTYCGVRLFMYLVLICTRETRHVHNKSEVAQASGNQFHPECGRVLMGLNGGSHGAVQYLFGHPPQCSLGEYAQHLSFAFYKGHYSGGYGGKKWGVVADALKRYALGEFSMEMLLDVGFTLAHNGGPIFNKGMLYGHYNRTDLYTVLDVQRAGQMPEFVLSVHASGNLVEGNLKGAVGRLNRAWGAPFKAQVDWPAVQAAGAVQNYVKEQHDVEGAAPKVGPAVGPDEFLVHPKMGNNAALIVKKIKVPRKKEAA